MTRAEILKCLTDRPCDSCKFHESGRCERWNCVFEEKPDDCDDAISRISVLDTLDTTDKFMDEERTVENYKALLKECYEVLPSVTPKQRWIPTSERLPKPYGQVLRTVKSVGWNGTFDIYVDMGAICPIDTDVIAWMPLPEPYEPQVNEDEIVSLEFSEDIDTPGKFQTKDGVWHTATF